MSAELSTIALSAAYQANATLHVLGRLQSTMAGDMEQFELVLQAALPRIQDLTTVIIKALDEQPANAEELRAVVDRWAATSSI